MATGFELPPEARALFAQVSELEDRLHGLRDEFNRDLARARAAGIEVDYEASLRHSMLVGRATVLAPLPHRTSVKCRIGVSTSVAPVGGENAAMESLREQVSPLGAGVTRY